MAPSTTLGHFKNSKLRLPTKFDFLRYFLLVVEIRAYTKQGNYPICCEASEKIIVRVSIYSENVVLKLQVWFAHSLYIKYVSWNESETFNPILWSIFLFSVLKLIIVEVKNIIHTSGMEILLYELIR